MNQETYMERIINLVAEQDAITSLEATPNKLEFFMFALENKMHLSYAEGKWSAQEIMAHLADTEIIFGLRFRQAMSEEKAKIQSINEQRLAKHYKRLEPALAFESFRSLRAWNLALLANFDLQDWLKDVEHEERGTESLELMLRYWAGHDLNHLLQLERIVKLKEFN